MEITRQSLIEYDGASAYPSIAEYVKRWENETIKTPLCILIGGYAGTGKSTAAEVIRSYIPYIHVFPTGIFRAAISPFLPPDKTAITRYHTYDLHELASQHNHQEVGDLNAQTIDLFHSQAELVQMSINPTMHFLTTEKQHLILDGNHITPEWTDQIMNLFAQLDLIICPVFSMVSDPKVHREMLGGPTHHRSLDERQFETARILHDHIVSTAIHYGLPIYEYNELGINAMRLIETSLQSFLATQ